MALPVVTLKRRVEIVSADRPLDEYDCVYVVKVDDEYVLCDGDIHASQKDAQRFARARAREVAVDYGGRVVKLVPRKRVAP